MSKPRAALNKWDVLDHLGWDPHPGQLRVAESGARHRVVSAGRRWGKSALGGHELLPEVFATYTMREQLKTERKRREFWIVGPEYSDSEKEFRVVWNELKALEVPFDRPGSYNNPESGLMHISLWDGCFQLSAKSAKHPETLVGEGLRGAILAEAAKLKEKVWTRFIRPTLADFGGWSLHTSTPEGKNWFYSNWRRGQDPANPDWESWRMPSWNNSYVYRQQTSDKHVKLLQEMLRYSSRSAQQLIERYGFEIDPEILSLLLDLTPEAFNQEIGADFSEYVGKVFGDFDEEVHVTDLRRKPNWDLVACCDYGFTNPSVWLLAQVGPWGEVEILGEVYKSGLSPDEFADEILRQGLCPDGVRWFYPDPASPGDTRILENRLRVRSKSNTGGQLKYRLDLIREALKLRPSHLPDDHPEKQPKLKLDRSCSGTINDMSVYRYPENASERTGAPELPMKSNDHGPEALGRLFKGHFGTADQRQSRRGVRRVRVGR